MKIPDTAKIETRCKTVYRKAVVYFRTDIEFNSDEELTDKIADFESNVCFDLDNAHGGYFDYEFRYNGLEEIAEIEVPDWIFDD
ncbi:MAG: hypothetical protein IKN27_02540 [Selenomonadaceae bacterium]|nr:hypothetical protein [Selenomonadaceae bacterium]